MFRAKWTNIRERIRESFSGDDASDASSARTPNAIYFNAARARIETARSLLLEGRTLASLVLYREGSLLLACAYLAAAGDTFDEPPADHDLIVRFAALLEQKRVSLPPEFETTRAALVSAERLTLDRLEPADAVVLARAFDGTARWLSSITRPSVPRPRRMRLATWLGLAAILLGLATVVAVKWVFPPRNVARRMPVQSSSVAYGTAASAVVNGDRYEKLAFHSAVEQSPWLSIDLKRVYSISSVRVYGRGECCFNQSVPLVFEVSDDGKKYRSVAERLEQFSQFDPWVIEPRALKARYLRLRSRQPILVLSEIEVYGKPRG